MKPLICWEETQSRQVIKTDSCNVPENVICSAVEGEIEKWVREVG